MQYLISRPRRPRGGRITAAFFGVALATLTSNVALAADAQAPVPADTNPSPTAWFPTTLNEDDVTVRPPAQLIAVSIAGSLQGGPASTSLREPTVIPLPPAALTGMAGLGTLALVGWRRALLRFMR